MKYVERAYPWLLLSPILLPVVIWGGLIYPYLVPKTLLFYTLSLLALASFVLLATHGRAFYYGRISSRASWIPAALLVLAYITSLAGVDLYRSFWSLFVRGDGLLMLTGVTVYFYLILIFADRTFFERFIRAVALVGSFVAVYGIGEWILGGGRIGSLLGNAAFFAGYLGISFFVTLLTLREAPAALKNAIKSGALLQLIAIVLTATRGTILALGVALGLYLIYLARTGHGKQRTWARNILIALVVFTGIFIIFRSEFAKFPFSPVARLATISMKDSDVSSRVFIWKNMVTEIEKSPWIGVGAEHIDVLFNRFYDPSQISEQWFDRSHNAYLDYAAQYGIGGLILYLALIVAFVMTARKLEKEEFLLFGMLAVTYAVQNFFVFDTVSSFWLFIVALALVSARVHPSVRETLALPAWQKFAAYPVALVLVALIVPVSVQPARAAYDLASAYAYQLVDVPKETSLLSHGIALSTYADIEYGYEAYDIYANNQVTRLSGEPLSEAYQAARSILTTNFNRYPYDARTALYLAHVLSLAPAGVTVDSPLLSSALERAIRLSPKRSQPWYVLVNLALTEANTHPATSVERAAGYAAAKDILNRYIALVPYLSQPHFVLAELERASGDMTGAALEAQKGKDTYKDDLPTAQRAAGYYEKVSDWQNAKFFLMEVVRITPADDVSRYDLAKVSYLSGDPQTAEAIVATLRKTNPNLLATDQNFLNAITAYEQSK